MQQSHDEFIVIRILVIENAFMKQLLTVFFSLYFCLAFSQQKTIDLVEAEKSFARYAMEYNTRDAFLKFMDSNAIVFEKGEILNARQIWEAKKPNTAKLIWEPAFAIISTAGDLGITTGPWQYKLSANDTTIVSGVFTSVWCFKNNEWKWLIDIGVEHNLKTPAFSNVASIELNHLERTTYDAGRYLLIAEQNFINSYTAGGKEAYNSVADNDIYLINPGQLPVSGRNDIDAALVNMSGAVQFKAVGSGVSKEGDIGYVYGYANEKDKKGNYLRIWRRVGRKWTLLLQTLTI